ncbi:hypothetical protein VNO77_24430 [Canavalia gladiata]|uniref:Uncharacterized protein n=1 Tax=Canavalia gladiata TaxID=3824 RepID=A0AAN9QCL8_CANGL
MYLLFVVSLGRRALGLKYCFCHFHIILLLVIYEMANLPVSQLPNLGNKHENVFGCYNGVGTFAWGWNSSASFLYGGLVPIFAIIGLALVVAVCSLRSGGSQRGSFCDCDANNSKGSSTSTQVEDPTVLVILAGEEHPTHLAKPISL